MSISEVPNSLVNSNILYFVCPVTTNFSSDSVGIQSCNTTELSSECESRMTHAHPKPEPTMDS